jgi:hypothetical protein
LNGAPFAGLPAIEKTGLIFFAGNSQEAANTSRSVYVAFGFQKMFFG